MYHKSILTMAIVALLISALPGSVNAKSLQIIASAGVYHRLDQYTDYKLLKDNYGSETPATVSLGVRLKNCLNWYCMGADSIDVIYHHQSYIDEGAPFNTREESSIDMVGINATWVIKEWNF